jgi:hypothetical protein
MSPIPLGILAASGAAAAGAMELISTQVLSSSASSVTFSSIPQDFKHLQIRYLAKNSSGGADIDVRFNNLGAGGGAEAIYARHDLRGTGSAVQSSASTFLSAVTLRDGQATSSGTSIFAAGVIDILDYANSAKNPVLRAFYGQNGSGVGNRVYLASGIYPGATPVTSLQLTQFANSFVSGSRFSIYGIKGD